MEKKGIRTELGDYNKVVQWHNFPVSVAEHYRAIEEKKALIEKLEEELQKFLESIMKGVTRSRERLLQAIAGSTGSLGRGSQQDSGIEAADTDAFLEELGARERAAEKERENRDNEQKRLDAEREQSLREQEQTMAVGTERTGSTTKELTSDYELS